jgi:hypothetical protein
MRQQTPQAFRASPDWRCRHGECEHSPDLQLSASTILVLPLVLAQIACCSGGNKRWQAPQPSVLIGRSRHAGCNSSSSKRHRATSVRSSITKPTTKRVRWETAIQSQRAGEKRMQSSSLSIQSPSIQSPVGGSQRTPLAHCSGCAPPFLRTVRMVSRLTPRARDAQYCPLAYPLRQTTFDLFALRLRKDARTTL